MTMPASRLTTVAFGVSAIAALAGCGTVGNATRGFAESITPYKVEVVQGNFVSREQVEALKPGMGRVQVRDILGTPLLADPFHAERWDYVFTLRRQGVEPQQRRLTLYFRNDVLDRFEGDTMPSEAEFVATLDKKAAGGKVPPLEATEDQLAKFPVKPAAAATPAAEPPPQPNYPPLETPAR